MALINCPECGREVSDTIEKCPHCGYVLKKPQEQTNKPKSKAPIIAIAVILVICIAAAYFFIIQPQQKLSQAEALISRGKYNEAEVILSQLGNSKKKDDLLIQISLAEVEDLIKSGDYSAAEKKLATVPVENISPELREELAVKQAEAYMSQGKYTEADQALEAIGQTEEVVKLREQLSYESRVFSCIKEIKKILKNPDSLSIYDVAFYKTTKKDEAASTEGNDVYIDTEPSCVMHYGAQNGFGGNTTSYALFTWDDEDQNYSFLGSVNSLDEDDLNENDDDYFYDLISLAAIKSTMERESVGSIDLERVQTLLKNNNYSIIKIIH